MGLTLHYSLRSKTGSSPQALNRVRTRLAGWRWESFCKTQYASIPKYGGVKNFLRCHVGLVTLLDKAKLLGLVEEVDDEAGYWEDRDLSELARAVGVWSPEIAELAGRVKGKAADHVLMEIAKLPDCEPLEVHGHG